MGGDGKQNTAEAAKPGAEAKKGGSGHVCGGRLSKRFEQAKERHSPQGAIAVLAETMRNGTPEEKGIAKTALITNLNNSQGDDYITAVSSAFEAADGNPVVRSSFTSHASVMLDTEEGRKKLFSLLAVKDESVRIEIIKAVADTHNPAAKEFIIVASDKCKHNPKVWQLIKILNRENAGEIESILIKESSNLPADMCAQMLQNAKSAFAEIGLPFSIPETTKAPAQNPSSTPEPVPVMRPQQVCESVSSDFQPDTPPLSPIGMPIPVFAFQSAPAASADMSTHMRNMEAFYRRYGMVSVSRRKAKASEISYDGMGREPEARMSAVGAEEKAGIIARLKAAIADNAFSDSATQVAVKPESTFMPGRRNIPESRLFFRNAPALKKKEKEGLRPQAKQQPSRPVAKKTQKNTDGRKRKAGMGKARALPKRKPARRRKANALESGPKARARIEKGRKRTRVAARLQSQSIRKAAAHPARKGKNNPGSLRTPGEKKRPAKARAKHAAKPASPIELRKRSGRLKSEKAHKKEAKRDAKPVAIPRMDAKRRPAQKPGPAVTPKHGKKSGRAPEKRAKSLAKEERKRKARRIAIMLLMEKRKRKSRTKR